MPTLLPCSHDSMCGMQEVPGASEVVGEEEEEESPRSSHCQVHQTAQHATSLEEGRKGEREGVISSLGHIVQLW